MNRTEPTAPVADSISEIERELTVLLRRAEAAIARRPLAERLVRSGYLLLSVLETAGPVGIAALAEATAVDISTASRQILPLERQQVVRRLANPADGRGSLIEITELGRERLQTTREDRHRTYQELLGDWSEDDRIAFGRYLARINEAIVQRQQGQH
jgi:DNA-binding MarR family transcriptional regulator